MGIKDRSLLQGVFSANFDVDEFNSYCVEEKVPLVKLSSFKQKLNEGLFDEFVWKDWKEYFILKANQHGVTKYRGGDARKESGILKSIMTEFSPNEIKEMIDFVWDCDEHNLVPHKSTMGIWILSKGYLNSVVQLLILWKKEGTLKPKQNRPLTESKWEDKEPEEVSIMKPKRKSRISVGGE